jgi:hypothetical protein
LNTDAKSPPELDEKHRVRVALMTANDAELALRTIKAEYDLERLSAAWRRAKELGLENRAAQISARMDEIRGK